MADTLYQFGEERLSRRIARAIVQARAEAPIATTAQLAAIIRRVVPKDGSGIDPATRSFQALRIRVNDELGQIERALASAATLLTPGGRLVVVSFHSLEDRIVKRFMTEMAGRTPSPSRHDRAAWQTGRPRISACCTPAPAAPATRDQHQSSRPQRPAARDRTPDGATGMMRPFTCLCMLAAAGAGLYLYQEKYRAQLLDREIASVIKQIDKTHERTNLLKAEWSLLNDPERLSSLAAQHLTLQPLAPTQFAALADLGSRLPAPGTASDAAPAPVVDPAVPMAEATPPAVPDAAPQEVASLPEPDDDTPAPPAETATPAPRLAEAARAPTRSAAPKPAPEMAIATPRPATLQVAATRPIVRRPAVRRASPEQVAAAETPHPYRPLYAPVLSAFASGASAQAIHAPTVQRTAVGFEAPAPYVGSSLGMAAGALAAPVPISAGR